MAGTVTESVSKTGAGGVKLITLDVVGDASDGSVPDTALGHKFSGRVVSLETNPGSTAPTANYDITLEDGDGHDVLEGVGANRSDSATEKVAVVFSGTSVHPPVDISETLTLKIANQSVNSADIKIKLYISEGP